VPAGPAARGVTFLCHFDIFKLLSSPAHCSKQPTKETQAQVAHCARQ